MYNFLFLIFFLFISILSKSQLCTGSLGDPVINIDFGTVGNISSNYVPAGSYSFSSSTCPNDGFYTIATSTNACFGSTWHSVNSDHTGGGAFMLVNASFQPSDFFLTTVSGLCPNTTYEFSAWVMNVLISPTGIEPDITFSIETPGGIILNQFNTNGIAVSTSPTWKQYGFFFTTTAGTTDVVLRMTNNAAGGLGNDLALDDITFRPCGPVINSMIIGNSNPVNACVDQQPNLIFSTDPPVGFSNPVFLWQVSIDSGKIWNDINGATSLTYQRLPTSAGSFWYRMSIAENGNAGIPNCRVFSNVLKIVVHPNPLVNAGPDIFLINGQQEIFAATVSGDSVSVFWSPPDFLNSTTILNPIVTPLMDKDYTLSAISKFGCSNEDQVSVKVVAGIFVPTAFTPNNDGKNDFWRIPFLDPQVGAEVNVYNRYGQVVYSTSGSVVSWDGKLNGVPQSAGTFVYYIHFKNGLPDLKGTFTLIR